MTKKTIVFILQFPSFHYNSQKFRYETLNDDRNLVENSFYIYNNGEDICSPVWVAFVMAGVVPVNETRSASW